VYSYDKNQERQKVSKKEGKRMKLVKQIVAVTVVILMMSLALMLCAQPVNADDTYID
jgi:hypothetical protein